MRALLRRVAQAITLALVGTSFAVTSEVFANPRPASGYATEVLAQSGAIFSGLGRDGNSVIVTNLADGRLYRHQPDGRLSTFGPALSHGVDVLGEPTGPYRVARHEGAYLVTTGWTPAGKTESAYDHAVLEIDERNVIRVVSADFMNPFAFAVSGDTLFVVDAGRNSVERVAVDGSERTTVFSFARLRASESALKRLSPTEFTGKGGYEFDAVPTGVVLARDKRLYVSLFGGFPFLAGSGRVVSLASDATNSPARIEAVDLNAPVDVTLAGDGRLLVLEHGTFDQGSGFRSGSGRLIAINLSSGARQVIVDGLTRPAAVLVLDERTTVISELGGTLVFVKRLAQ